MIPLLALRLFEHPQPLKIRFESLITQPLPQTIATVDQTGQIKAMTTLQPLQFRQTLLNPIEMLRVTLQSQAVVIEGPQKLLNIRLQIQGLILHRRQGTVQLSHRLQLLDRRGEMVLQ